MLRKIIIAIHKTIDWTAAIVSLLMFLICLYAMIDAYNVYEGANDKSLLKVKPKAGNTQMLRELSDDAVAWLTVDDTRIDYPVMQGKTNAEYLNKNPYGDFSLAGSIFLDSRNDKSFGDDYSMIYGHHMEYGAMFGSLDDYADKGYLESHNKGTLSIVNGKKYKITLFASCKTHANDKVVFDPFAVDNGSLLGYLEKNAIVYLSGYADSGSKLVGEYAVMLPFESYW